MDRGIRKVRKSIEQRKRMRGVPKGNQTKRVYPSIPQDEEKHGFYPLVTDDHATSRRGENVVAGIAVKGMLSVMLFFGVAILHQNDSELLSKPKDWTSSALSEEFPFAKVNNWYRTTFGEPLAFTPQKDQTVTTSTENSVALPVSGSISESFQVNGKGIMISPGETAEVTAMQEGIVVFAGKDRNTNKTVVIQHADGTTTSYGHLSNIDVHLYQYVTNNQQVGEFTPTSENEMVYFSIEMDDKYIDPVQVIQVDETP
ncbi:M23 family metallopeptidase [Oceanobacillus bengalensis]|uniref:M23 family metallopeptidase n=1 Tax=Oceanobacillus bengalensis TaxID=1435466 RepID=A0A494Z5U2_9BACI|nr:M23 family metallopeptidase [Oceanobacillus bengalensis]RKQ17937.1 M23 family metallopeptidase [Oceanobacillus bengalensis]